MKREKEPKYSEIKDIELSQIHIENNPRTRISQVQIEELAKSIAHTGLIHPITIFDNGEHFILISGERRFRAAQFLKWKTIPCREVKNATPVIVSEIQLVENNQRQDMHPLDEAFAFERLSFGAEEIALRLGKSLQYVYDRLNLLKLSAQARTMFYDNHFTLSHALQLCRIPESEQDKMLSHLVIFSGKDENRKSVCGNVQSWKNAIHNRVQARLKDAKFDPAIRFKEVISCKNCQYRSGTDKHLFNDIEEDDVCHNPSCFNLKNLLHCLRLEKQLKEYGIVPIRLTGIYDHSTLAEKYNLQDDFIYCATDITIEEARDWSEPVYGLYFEHHLKSRIGQLVYLERKAEETQKPEEEKERKKTALEEVKTAKARKTFFGAIMEAFGQRIGEHDSERVPVPVVLSIAETIYLDLRNEQKAEIHKWFKWSDVSADLEKNRQTFRKHVENLDYEEVIQLLLILFVYNSIQNNSDDFHYVNKLAVYWKVDVLRIVAKIEKDFEVKLDVIKKLF